MPEVWQLQPYKAEIVLEHEDKTENNIKRILKQDLKSSMIENERFDHKDRFKENLVVSCYKSIV